MVRTWLTGILITGVAALATVPLGGQPPAGPKPGEVPALPAAPVIRLAPQGGKPIRALKYRLLPDPLDLTSGNAATLWLRAGHAARIVPHKITEKEYSWASPDGVTLNKLPRQDVRAFLDRYHTALRYARQAARRDRCDWERPPLTLESLNELPLDDIQSLRELAQLLSIQCRLELSEGHFARAAETLQTGFAMARHIGESNLLIQDLVAIAIASIMLGRVEEWIQTPGSPNLYWALSDLPRPFVSVRRSIHHELNTIHRSFPQLREMQRKPRSPEEVRALIDKLFGVINIYLDRGVPPDTVKPLARKVGTAVLVMKYYPDAKKYLLAHGRTAKEVQAMPTTQVVILYYIEEYDRVRDDILKWLSVPSWQGRGPLEELSRKVDQAVRTRRNPFIDLLMPALLKVHAAQLRLERQIAGLRGAEGLRLYAASHPGKVPAKWADITEAPLPIDPFTGKGLDAFYRVKAGKATLDIPPPPRMPPMVGRRFELTSKGR
jgi:hypothetical protein